MALEKIGGKSWIEKIGGPPCLNPEHNPPSMIVLPPGRYRHTCPGCGESVEFTITGPVC